MISYNETVKNVRIYKAYPLVQGSNPTPAISLQNSSLKLTLSC